MCSHLTAAGEKPACVKNCCGTARFYGDLDDPSSDVSKELAKYPDEAIHHLPDVGNAPLTAYILSPKWGKWAGGDLHKATGNTMTTEGSVD